MQIFNQPQPSAAGSTQQYLQLLLASVQLGIQQRGTGSVIAFTATAPGEGVSHVARSFAAELVRHTGKRTVIVDARRLQRLRATEYMHLPQECVQTNIHNLWMLPNEEFADRLADTDHALADAWQREPEFGFDRLQAFRSEFDYTLIDCPSLKESYEAAMLAPILDGVVLVVEADRTKRDQIRRAQQTIGMSNGKLLGLVLNKRRYLVPKWLYRMF
jgi:Mrp family chromosome partitioning ATPase